jgi:hypothetical protein
MARRWMLRWCCLALTWGAGLTSLNALEAIPTTSPIAPTSPATVDALRFDVGTSQFYVYSLKQTVAWTSAGETLTFSTTMSWKFLLSVTEVAPERITLDATILRIQASHSGPGRNRAVDSNLSIEHDGGDDPLIGHLLALKGAVLRITIAPTSGLVTEVRGGDEIVARINKRVPSVIPGKSSDLEPAAKAAFSSEALTRLWNQMLVQPTTGVTRVPLGPPLGGEVEQVWQGSTYRLSLPAGTNHLNATLVGDPTPVSVVLSELTGTGTTSVGKNGLPGVAKGELGYLVTFNALTQPVAQRHQVIWELTPIDPR